MTLRVAAQIIQQTATAIFPVEESKAERARDDAAAKPEAQLVQTTATPIQPPVTLGDLGINQLVVETGNPDNPTITLGPDYTLSNAERAQIEMGQAISGAVRDYYASIEDEPSIMAEMWHDLAELLTAGGRRLANVFKAETWGFSPASTAYAATED